MKEITFNRAKAGEYAHRWAYSRNPRYMDYTEVWGDEGNFASQCIYAGCGVMNHSRHNGWYYHDSRDFSASWMGPRRLYEFLTENQSFGPYGTDVDSPHDLQIGDVVFFTDRYSNIYHCAVVSGNTSNELLLTAHCHNAFMRPLSTYAQNAKYVHLLGARRAE